MFFQNKTFKEIDSFIMEANRNGTNFDSVRLLQQTLPVCRKQITNHIQRWKDCRDCSLGQSAYVNNRIFYRGYVPADILFLIDAPSTVDDASFRPAMDERGWLLDCLIKEASTQLFGKDNGFRWCISNAVCCTNFCKGEYEVPTTEEIRACGKRLVEFLRIADPKIIITFGPVPDRAIKLINKEGLLSSSILVQNHSRLESILKQTKDQDVSQMRIILSIMSLYRKCFPDATSTIQTN